MATMYATQKQVIVVLRSIGEPDLADRLERCMTARRDRRGGDGWPFTCRSAACVWCRRPMIRSWWNGMCQWSAEATTWSLAVIPLHLSAGLPDAVRRLRRGLRDVRDRMARHKKRWRDVCCTGMAGGDGRALVMISHEDIDRHEVEAVLRRRWPECRGEGVGAGGAGRGDVARRCCRSRTVPPRCRAVADRRHAPARSAGSPRPSIEPMPVLV